MRITAAGAAGALGLVGLGLAVVAAPVASAAGSADTSATAGSADSVAERLAARVQAVKDALAGLVSDGSITQQQADEVATTLGDSGALHGGFGGLGGLGGFGGFGSDQGGFGGFGGVGGVGSDHGGHGGGFGARSVGGPLALDAAADALGLTADELRAALEVDGTTLADVAATEGVQTQVLVDALVTATSARLDEAVANGDLTQARADEIEAALPEQVASAIEQEQLGGHGRGPWGDRDDDTSDDSAATPWDEPSASTSGAVLTS